MFDLTDQQIEAVLDAVNAPAARKQIKEVLSGEDLAYWKQHENDPVDTTSSPLRQDLIREIEEILLPLRHSDSDPRIPGVLKVADVYFHSGSKARWGSHDALLKERGQLLAFVLCRTLFVRSAGKEFQARPFLGYDQDPVTWVLPYLRKYDRERMSYYARSQRDLWERLDRARDLVGLLARRVQDTEVSPYVHGARDAFEIPDFQDIRDALREDNLSVGIDDFVLFGGKYVWELAELERDLWDEEPPRVLYPALAEGSYQGALTQLRYPGGSSFKKMTLVSLEKLQNAISDLLQPLSDDELEAREAQVQELRSTIGRS